MGPLIDLVKAYFRPRSSAPLWSTSLNPPATCWLGCCPWTGPQIRLSNWASLSLCPPPARSARRVVTYCARISPMGALMSRHQSDAPTHVQPSSYFPGQCSTSFIQFNLVRSGDEWEGRPGQAKGSHPVKVWDVGTHTGYSSLIRPWNTKRPHVVQISVCHGLLIFISLCQKGFSSAS